MSFGTGLLSICIKVYLLFWSTLVFLFFWLVFLILSQMRSRVYVLIGKVATEFQYTYFTDSLSRVYVCLSVWLVGCRTRKLRSQRTRGRTSWIDNFIVIQLR